MININYDNKYDVLYITFSDKESRKNSLGDEEYNGLVVMRDKKTNNITGLIVMGFSDKYKKNKIPVFPPEITLNVEKDVVPFISF